MTEGQLESVTGIEEPVLVAVHRLDGEQQGEVKDACERAHARFVPWSGEVALPDLKRRPSILVTGLRVGERRIPDDVIDLATNAYPDLALLVLCREPLLRPTMTLSNGRVTLVSPPLTAPRVASALRSLLADRSLGYSSTDTATGPIEGSSAVAVRRHRRADYSIATVACAGVDRGAARAPMVRHSKTEGLTTLIVAPGATLDVHVNSVAACFKGDKSDSERVLSLEKLLGDDAAVLHLRPGVDEWLFYWPNPHWHLLLSSPLRLPNVWNMSRSMERARKKLLRFDAAHCDMVAALTSLPAADRSADAQTAAVTSTSALMPSLAEGGAALLEHLEHSFRIMPQDFAGAVVEVF